jgi:hypothetical protein
MPNNTLLQVSASTLTVLRCLASGLDLKSAEYIASLEALNKPTQKELQNAND